MTMFRNNRKGQTALVLILLAAAGLVFYAATLNWGSVVQEKVVVTMAAQQAAASLASSVASYGEAMKCQYLNNHNENTYTNWDTVLRWIELAVTLAAAVAAAIFTGGGSLFGAAILAGAMAVASAGSTIALHMAYVVPKQAEMWNNMMKSQPPSQQMEETAIATGLQMIATDTVNITDYFDSNANGLFGLPNTNKGIDSVGRYSFFYNERLKMFNGTLLMLGPLVDKFKKGMKTLAESLSDPCDQNPAALANPYCNPCCQPYFMPRDLNGETLAGHPFNHYWTDRCPDFRQDQMLPCPNGTPGAGEAHPPDCDICQCVDKVASGKTCDPYNIQCGADTVYGALYCEGPNNPYSKYAGRHPFLFDPVYQKKYSSGLPTSPISQPPLKVLGQWGRDVQMPDALPVKPPSPLELQPPPSPDNLYDFSSIDRSRVEQGIFPNGFYPFFYYSAYNKKNPPIKNIAGSNYTTDAEGSYEDAGVNIPRWWEPYGDNQMCSPEFPYNKAGQTMCNSNPDLLDETWHTLADLVALNTVIDKNPTTFTDKNLNGWYGKVADFIAPNCNEKKALRGACDTQPNEEGRLLKIYNPYKSTPTDLMLDWEKALARWLGYPFPAPPQKTWCVINSVPPSSKEDVYIRNCGGIDNSANIPCSQVMSTGHYVPYGGVVKDVYKSFVPNNGDMGHVLACLDYNANDSTNPSDANVGAAAAFIDCYNTLLTSPTCPLKVSDLPSQCKNLNRSLVGNPPPWDGPGVGCKDDGCTTVWKPGCQPKGKYLGWLNNSINTALKDANKFSTRADFLRRLYNEAVIMMGTFSQLDSFLQEFLGKPSTYTESPAYALMEAEASLVNQGVSTIPNAAIYGWEDDSGLAHLVKVTAYSAGRPPKDPNSIGYVCPDKPGKGITYKYLFGEKIPVSIPDTSPVSNGSSRCFPPALPWVHNNGGEFDVDNVLYNRDGWVFVKVQRWDQPHSSFPLRFPNKLPLWTFNQGQGSQPQSPIDACVAGGARIGMGFGISPQMRYALKNYSKLTGYDISPADRQKLGRAFMIDDNPSGGLVDPSAKDDQRYASCVDRANQLLRDEGMVSQACVAYIATDSPQAISPELSSPVSEDGQDRPGTGSNNYTLLFEKCPNPDLPDDLQ